MIDREAALCLVLSTDYCFWLCAAVVICCQGLTHIRVV